MNGMPWYRRYNGTWKDPVFRWVARLADAKTGEALSVWDVYLEESSASDFRGTAPKLDPGLIAAQLDYAVDTVRRIAEAFVQVGLIAGDIIVGWAKRQGEAAVRAGAAIASAAMKPRTRHAIKQEAYRRRQADAARQFALELGGDPAAESSPPPPDEPVTRPVTSAEKAVTKPVTRGTDRDSESSTASAVEGGATTPHHPAPERRAAGSRKTASGRTHGSAATRRSRIPTDWQPGDADYAFAAQRGRDASWVDSQAALFAAHHGSKGTLSTDWHLNWRTWVLRDQEFECRRSTVYAGGGRRERPSIVAINAEMQDWYRSAV